MDFSELIIKEESDDSKLEFHVDIENINNDWCIEEEYVRKVNELGREELVTVGYEHIDDLRRCFRCNKLFIDGYSLLRHNLTHMEVFLEKLPEQIVEFYEPPGLLIEMDHRHSNSDVDEEPDLQQFSFNNNLTDVKVKFELISSKSDAFSDIDEPKDISDKDNKNDNVLITKKMHRCLICNKVYNYKHWSAHMNDVHPKQKLKCDICNKEYKCKQYLKRHPCFTAKKKKKKEIQECCLCRAVLKSKACLRVHIRSVHSTSAVRCEICNSQFKSEVYLLTHLRRVHYDDGKVHNCDICGKIFKSPRYLGIHMKNSHLVSSKKMVKF